VKIICKYSKQARSCQSITAVADLRSSVFASPNRLIAPINNGFKLINHQIIALFSDHIIYVPVIVAAMHIAAKTVMANVARAFSLCRKVCILATTNILPNLEILHSLK
jgi:hypothetical protein